MRISAFILNRKEFDWFSLFLFLQQIYRKSGHKEEEEEEEKEKESWATGSFEQKQISLRTFLPRTLQLYILIKGFLCCRDL